MSSIIEQAAKISAKRKFDETYKDGGEDLEALKQFLNETWAKHKDAFWKHVATEEKPEFEFRIKLPQGLAYSKDDVREVLLAQVDDFKGANEGAGGVYVIDESPLGMGQAAGLRTEFLVHICWAYYHGEFLRELKDERTRALKRNLAPTKKKAKKEPDPTDAFDPFAVKEEEVKEEEEGCWNVVVPAKDGKPERLIPMNLAVVRKGSKSVTHLSFK